MLVGAGAQALAAKLGLVGNAPLHTPARLEAVKDRQVEPQPAPLPSYEELAEWLSAEPAIRRAFPRRFAARARESAFRSGLAQHLGQHPEWEPVLFPERFIKPTPSPSR
jgi:hypothetical protein